MKKKVMRTFCCILATLFLSVPGIAYAAETGNAPADNVQNCEIQILSTDVEHNRSLARVTKEVARIENGCIFYHSVKILFPKNRGIFPL